MIGCNYTHWLRRFRRSPRIFRADEAAQLREDQAAGCSDGAGRGGGGGHHRRARCPGRHFLTHLPTSPRTRRTGLRHALPTMCLTVCVITVSGTAAADPISPQCWACLQRLASELPAVNPQEDPSYEQGLTPGSVLPALANCSLDDGEIPTLQQVIKVFTDAQVAGGGPAYVREHLASLPKVSAEDRAKLVDGATKDLDTTLRHLVDHNCRTSVAVALRRGRQPEVGSANDRDRAKVARDLLSDLQSTREAPLANVSPRVHPETPRRRQVVMGWMFAPS